MKKIDLNKIVEESLEFAGYKKEKTINEALVAQQKTYRNVTESISQKTKDAHERLYKNYIEKFNKTSAQLDAVSKESDSNNSEYRNLKLSETYNANSIWLHELYFSNCFDPHSEIYADSYSYLKLQRDFGTFEDWQKDFMATALASRNGWAICGYNFYFKKYVNLLIDDHSNNVMLGVYPILVIDMWDHALYKDYLDDRQSYLIAQMREINWQIVEERIKKSEKIAEVIK